MWNLRKLTLFHTFRSTVQCNCKSSNWQCFRIQRRCFNGKGHSILNAEKWQICLETTLNNRVLLYAHVGVNHIQQFIPNTYCDAAPNELTKVNTKFIQKLRHSLKFLIHVLIKFRQHLCLQQHLLCRQRPVVWYTAEAAQKDGLGDDVIMKQSVRSSWLDY